MKVTGLLAISLIPFLWGWMYYHLFHIKDNFLLWIFIAYISFWFVERTIGFAFPFAGKNALIYGVAFLPVLMVFSIKNLNNKFIWILSGLGIFGIALINYSLLHLVSAVIGSYLIARFVKKDILWSDVLKLFGSLLIPSVLMLLLLGDVIKDPRAGSFIFSPVDGFLSMVESYTNSYSNIIIFNDADFGLMKYPYRGLVFLIILFVALGILIFYRRTNEFGSLLGIASGIFLLLAFSFGVIPLGITVDYARWLVWPIQAMAFCATISVLIGFFNYLSSGKFLLIVFGAPLLLISFYIFTNDLLVYRKRIAGSSISLKDLRELSEGFNKVKQNRRCYIISQSNISADRLTVAQIELKFDYLEIITGCKFYNGSWVDSGTEVARSYNGLSPIIEVEKIKNDAIFLVGENKLINDYKDYLKNSGMISRWVEIYGKSGIVINVNKSEN